MLGGSSVCSIDVSMNVTAISAPTQSEDNIQSTTASEKFLSFKAFIWTSFFSFRKRMPFIIEPNNCEAIRIAVAFALSSNNPIVAAIKIGLGVEQNAVKRLQVCVSHWVLEMSFAPIG